MLGDLGPSLAVKQEVEKEVHTYEWQLRKMAPSASPAVIMGPFSPFSLLGFLSVSLPAPSLLRPHFFHFFSWAALLIPLDLHPDCEPN